MDISGAKGNMQTEGHQAVLGIAGGFRLCRWSESVLSVGHRNKSVRSFGTILDALFGTKTVSISSIVFFLETPDPPERTCLFLP